jgi:menaquinone-dependent protoporphyrinogen oxidase
MDQQILVAYGTKHGSTREVAEAVAETLRAHELEVETRAAGHVDDISPYSGAVIGGAIYMGRWHPEALAFMRRHRRELSVLPVAAFGMGPRTLDADEVDASGAQLARALAKVPEVDPFAVAVFGGVVDPRLLRFPLNRMPASDARDWDEIRRWSAELADTLDFGKAAPEPRNRRSELQQTPR